MRYGIVPTRVREREANIGIAVARFLHDEAQDRARGVGLIFDHVVIYARNQIPMGSASASGAAVWHVGVNKDDGAAMIELFQQRGERWISEPFVTIAAEDTNTLHFERV